MVLTTLVIAGLASVVGIRIEQGLTIGMIFSASSTAIALQTLNEKGLMSSKGGQTSFSVLLFQDIAVIPILAIMPFLAMSNGAVLTSSGHGTEVAPWQRALLVLGIMVAIVVGGRFLIRPVFRYLASIRLHEIFTVAALLLGRWNRPGNGKGWFIPGAWHLSGRGRSGRKRISTRTRVGY